MKGPTLDDAVKNAGHYLALGFDEVYLSAGDLPWEHTSSCDPGGTHRLEIATSVWFRAKHPCGLTFRWSFDIEPRSANGSGGYEIDVEACRAVLSKLPNGAAEDFRNYLKDCAAKVRTKADEWSKHTSRQYGTAAALESAAKS